MKNFRVAGQDETQKDEATQKFQALGAVYKILCDKDSKAVYDETGEIPGKFDYYSGQILQSFNILTLRNNSRSKSW